MAHDPGLDRRTVVMIAVMTGLLGITGVGWGPVDGDQAVYLHQAATGAWTERWVHVGYVALLGLVRTSLGADLLNVALGCAAVLLIGWRTGVVGALLVAGSVLPWLPFGEVDLPWFAAVAGAQRFALLGAIAVVLSPTSLAAVPGWVHQRSAAAGWGILTAVLLVAISGGAWLLGNRGVLVVHWRPAPWVHLGWLVLPLGLLGPRTCWEERVRLGLLLPLLLAPADVPAHLLAVPLLAERAPRTLKAAARVLLAAHLILGGIGMVRGIQQAAREAQVLAQAAARIQPGDGVQSSWSLAVRASLQVAGRPDALLRRSDPTYCTRIPSRLWLLTGTELVLQGDPAAGCPAADRPDPSGF